ncbi:hypothetical protein LWHH1689_1731 [Limosilactobacillus reuteri]|uniref:Uncharacterized protein n=1 Tax=Limosilactobacillus reuteri TaxID=1598 RepID=A0A2S1ESQ9_LIMRT|nr:hypothetical protein LWHH1689_1731 [Limosilactobacillus reuteri]
MISFDIFFKSLPYNFWIASAVQLCISQPIERKVLLIKHRHELKWR